MIVGGTALSECDISSGFFSKKKEVDGDDAGHDDDEQDDEAKNRLAKPKASAPIRAWMWNGRTAGRASLLAHFLLRLLLQDQYWQFMFILGNDEISKLELNLIRCQSKPMRHQSQPNEANRLLLPVPSSC